MSKNNVLTIQSLSKFYDVGKFRIIGLPSINFNMQSGEKIIIRGKNGCGKSTLLKIIAKLINKTSGNIIYGNSILNSYSLKDQIGYIPEQIDFDQSMSPKSFWNLSIRLRKLDPNYQKFEEYLEYLKISKWVDQPIGSFSLGMKKRLMLAVWLSLDIKFLLLDEFESGLDKDAAELVKDLFEKQSDLTILAISHNYNSPVFETFKKLDFDTLLEKEET